MNLIDNKSYAAIKDYFATSASHTNILTSSDAALSQPNDSLEGMDCKFSAVCVSTQEGAPKTKRYLYNDTIILFPKDQTPLLLILPRCENRSMQAIWFDQFNGLRLNADDGTCHCTFCV